jgi:cytochrome c oxidase subunit IV
MMNTETESAHAEPGVGLFTFVWVVLLGLTAIEVLLAYVQVLSLKGMLLVLLALSFVKAGMIVAYFMHLRYEKPILVLSLIPAVMVVICLLFMFFPDSLRALELRVQ